MKWTEDHIRKLAKDGKVKVLKGMVVEEEAKPKRAKYGSVEVEYEGIKFQSRKEYRRYRKLQLLLKHGHIGQLRLQVKFVLIEAATEPIIGKRGQPLKRTRTIERKTEYWADFVYIDAVSGATVVEDTKSEATRKKESYIIKRKLMLKIHNISIKEV